MTDFGGFVEAIRRGDLNEVRELWTREYANERDWDGRSSLHCASGCDESGDIVRFLVDAGCDIEGVDDGGRRPVHRAALCGKAGALRVLVDAGCDIEEVDDGGRRPIHRAALCGKTDTLRILVDAGCSLKVVTECGDTPLDVATKYHKYDCVEILRTAMSDDELLENKDLWVTVDPQSGETVLDMALCRRSTRIIEAIRAKPVSKQEIKELESSRSRSADLQSHLFKHECLLYRCIRHNYQGGFVTLCTPEIVNREGLFMGPSALETAVEFECDLFVAHILTKMHQLTESWTRAVALAKEKELTNISLLLAERMWHIRDMEKGGYGRLHIAVYDNDPDMVRYILENKLCDPDGGHKTVGTALSLSYRQCHMRCVESLQDNNVNVNTVDRLRQSPLHVAIMNRKDDHTNYLVDNMRDIEAEDYMGLSVLAQSVMNDCRRICESIVGRVKELDKYVQIDSRLLNIDPDLHMVLSKAPLMPITYRETIPSLCVKVNRTIYPCLFNMITQQTIAQTDGNSNTLLHLCAVSLLPDMCHQLTLISNNVAYLNNRGETPLLSLMKDNHSKYMREKDNDNKEDNGTMGNGDREVDECDEFRSNLIKTVDVLITAGSSVNVESSEGFTLLSIATEYNSERLLMALVKKRELITSVKNAEWLSWFHRKFFVFLGEVLPLINKSLLSEWITVDLIKCTTTEADLSLVKAMYDLAVHDVQASALETILYKAATNSDEALFREMMVDEISTTSCLSGGESLLNCLIRERRTMFCRLLVNSKNAALLLEKKDVEHKGPLHVCIESGYWEMVDKLIWVTKSVNEEDMEGNTPLSLLLQKVSQIEEESTIERLMSYINGLILRSADLYRVNKSGKAVISYCTNTRLQQQVEEFFQETLRPPQATEICSICLDEPINCALTCGHMFCMTCADKGVYCYVCRSVITEKIRVFL